MRDENKFVIPEAIIISFSEDDVIVTSGTLGEWWGNNPGDEYHD